VSRRPRLALAAIGLVIALLAALVVAPDFVDWNLRRTDIARQIEIRLGRGVSIEGPLTLSLLPAPHLEAEQVRIANIAGATDADFASTQRLEMRLRVLPLLAGRLEFSSLVLIKPQIHLQRLADGRVNWRFTVVPPGATGAAVSAGPEGAPSPPHSWGAVIERIELRHAQISFRHPRIGVVSADQIDAEAYALGDDGPFHFSAKGRLSGAALSLEGSVGDLAADETPAELVVNLGDDGGRLGVGGVMTGRDAATVFNGRVTFKSSHPDRLAALLGAPPAPEGKLELQGSLSASLHNVSAPNLAIDLPGASLLGFAALNLEGDPQLDVKLGTAKLDLGPWTAASPPAKPVVGGGKGAAPAPKPADPPMRLAFTPPNWFGANVDLTAESVAWRGTLLRQARLNAQLANGELTINQVGATLPGDSQVNLFGFMTFAGGRPHFDGSFESGSDDLRSLLRWLAIDIGDVPADRLGAARFAGHVLADPDRIRLDSAELRVDGTRIASAIDMRLPGGNGGRPALGASFAIDTINADAYRRPAASPPPAPLAASTGLGSVAPPDLPPVVTPLLMSSPLSGPIGHWLSTFDANVKAHLDQLVAGGLSFRGIDLDGALDNGALALNSLAVADVNGTRAQVAGRILDLAGTARLDGVTLEAQSDEPYRLLGAFGPIWPSHNPESLSLSAGISGDSEALTVKTHAELGGMTGTIEGRIATPLSAPAFDLRVDASHPNLAALLRLFGLDYRRPAGAESAAASFRLTGDPANLQIGDLHLQLGDQSATGQASLALAGRPRFDATLSAGTVSLDALLGEAVTAALPVRANALRPPAEPARAIAKVMVAPPLQPAPRPGVEVGGIPDRFSRAPLDLDWMESFDGSLRFDGAAIDWAGMHLIQPDLIVSLTGGKATLDHLTAKLWEGDLTMSAVLDSQGALTLGATLNNGQLSRTALGLADLDLTQGRVDAAVELNSTGNSMAELIDRLSGTGRIEAHDGTLKGFDLAAADQRLKSPAPASLISLAQAGMKGGETNFSALTGTFRAAGGVISSDDLTLAAEGGTIDATVSVNLPANAIDSRVLLHLANAPDAPPLAMTVSGPLDKPRRVLDINPLQTWLAKRPKPAKPVTN
jgi:uncharacterized protein involved in outer membrane biogenesis